MTVYMAGPMHNAENHGVEWREQIAEDYPEIDWLNPIDMVKFDPEKHIPTEVVEMDKETIKKCDAVFVRDNGDRSVGTWREVEYAKETVEIPVVVYVPGKTLAEFDINDYSPWLRELNLVTPELLDAVMYLEGLDQ